MPINITTYSRVLEQLDKEFLGVIEPLNVSFYICTNELLVFDCIMTTNQNIKVGEKKSIYEIDALVRLLCLEKGVVSKDDSSLLFESAKGQIAFILEWNEYIKRVIVFDLTSVKTFNEGKFIELTTLNSKVINDAFLESYKSYRDERGTK